MPTNAAEKAVELLEPMLEKSLFVALTKEIASSEGLLSFVAEP